MALADTAALVASLELQDKFSATARKFDQTIGGLERNTSTLGRIGGQVSSGIGAATRNLAILGVAGVGVIATQVAAGIQSLRRLEEVNAATAAVIKSTGGAAGITAGQVRDLAEQFEGLNATMDDKVIQSAENVLLTFTSIGEKAFPTALQAALDMNQALGGGEEGLQGTIIQVGKALQDPIRGLTALRRVGVNFTKAQEAQIKGLVEANDLYGAQQLILQELGREFGGQFAAAGDTAAGKFAKFRDAIEDAQMSLATAFLPVLVRVADKLTTFLADPAVLAGIQEFGGTLADAFDAVVELAGNLPWESIGDAFKLMGTGSKALLDAFVGLPSWVQTAVLTGWGLNKLTGGALTGIVGALASGLVKGVLGINAGVVNINAATVTGAPGTGVPTGGGRGGGPPGLLTLGVATIAITGTATLIAAGEGAFGGNVQRANEIVTGTAGGGLGGRGLVPPVPVKVTNPPNIPDTSRSERIRETQQTQQMLQNLRNATEKRLQTLAGQGMQNIQLAIEARAATQRHLQELATSNSRLTSIANKDFKPTVRVTANVTSNVSITDITRRLVSQHISIGGTTGGFIE